MSAGGLLAQTPTKYTYTGQFSNVGDFGLMFYNARWYDPSLGRFAQADTVVPDASHPQSYDRYAYSFNNPLKYIDPTGHDVCDEDGYCYSQSGKYRAHTRFDYWNAPANGNRIMNTDTDHDGVPNIPDPSYPATQIGRHLSQDCLPGNLVECFYDRGVMPAGDYDITSEEYYSLMLAVSYDIDKQNPILNYQTRGVYDTPFYDLGGLRGTICVEGSQCRSRAEYNYIAQGEWSAASLEGEEGMTAVITGWKLHEYGHLPSLGDLASGTEGFDAYTAIHPASAQFMLRGYRNYLSGLMAFIRNK